MSVCLLISRCMAVTSGKGKHEKGSWYERIGGIRTIFVNGVFGVGDHCGDVVCEVVVPLETQGQVVQAGGRVGGSVPGDSASCPP